MVYIIRLSVTFKTVFRIMGVRKLEIPVSRFETSPFLCEYIFSLMNCIGNNRNIVFVQRICASLTNQLLIFHGYKKIMYARYFATNQYSTAYHADSEVFLMKRLSLKLH
jgi:hypothetical protein